MIELLKESLRKYKILIFCGLLVIFNISWYVIKENTKDEMTLELKGETQEEKEVWSDEEKHETALTSKQPAPQPVNLPLNVAADKEIPVYICGEVICPGVYYVKPGAIIYDVLMMSGGTTKTADINFLNLADPVEAHQKIYLPKVGEEIDKTVNSYENSNEVSPNGTVSASSKTSQTVSRLININTASEEELLTLSGIGKVKAKAIIEYRTNAGAFKTIDDLLNVSGIGSKTLEKIRAYITV